MYSFEKRYFTLAPEIGVNTLQGVPFNAPRPLTINLN